MSSDEETELRDKRDSENEDVVAHRYVSDEPGEEDLEGKRKRKESEEPQSDDFGKRKR